MVDVVLPLLLAAVAFTYAVGLRNLWANARTARLVGIGPPIAFATALVVLLVALTSLLDGAATSDLPVHMVQHLLLLAVAAPLFAISEPVVVMLRALPDGGRRRVQPYVRRVIRSQTSTRGWLAWMVVADALSSAALLLWHAPAAYDAAVRHPAIHALEHATFLITSALFWWMALGATRRSRRGLGVLAVFAATLPATALGIAMTLSRTPWYSTYGHGPSALHDQQVAGALMWGFGGAALVIGAAGLFASWLASMEQAERSERERAQQAQRARGLARVAGPS
jgi:cytochrome c oxidase assembly factor CtaG